MRDIEWSKWVKKQGDDVVFGVELEFILFDLHSKSLNTSLEKTESFVSALPKQIYRDYYAWQLEIRTTPTDNISKCLDETLKLYKMASKEALNYGLMVVPVPFLTDSDNVYCGMHMHLSFPKLSVDDYWKKAMGLYPFILSIADHAKNAEVSDKTNSIRILDSRHIGFPMLLKEDFLDTSLPTEERKYKDIILSPPNGSGSGRHRLPKPATLEIRIFDTPSLFSMYSFIVESVVHLARHLRTDNPMVKEIEDNYDEARRKLSITRNLITGQRYGINKIFRMYNGNVCEAIAEYFSISYPEETQFEYREKKKMMADINGFISMAVEGGWI